MDKLFSSGFRFDFLICKKYNTLNSCLVKCSAINCKNRIYSFSFLLLLLFAFPARRLSIKAQTVRPILSVAPIRAMVDEKFKVLVENLPPASPVTIHSLHQSEDQDYWEAYGHYISDHRGTVYGGF